MKTQWMIWLAVMGMTIPASAQLVSSHSSSPAIAAPSTVQQGPAGRPVARVNGAVLTDLDLSREEYAIFPYARQHNGKIPPQMEPGIRQGAMQMIIFEELVYQEAQRRQMVVPADKLQKAQIDFRKQFPSPEAYKSMLQGEFHGSEAKLQGKIKRSLLIDQLLKSDVDSKSMATRAEQKAFYDKNAKRFEYPESFAVQTISFIPPQKATPAQLAEARKRAEALLAKAKATKTYEEFGLLAEKHSEDDYRVMMGDHKFVYREQMAAPMVEALLKMQPGQVTDILQVEQIYTIVRLNLHVLPGKAKFDKVQAQIKKEVEQSKTNQIRSALDKKLRQSAKIEVL